MDKKRYDEIIAQLRNDQMQIRADAEREVADLEQAIAVLAKRANVVASISTSSPRPIQETFITIFQPTDESIIYDVLRSLGGRSDARKMFEAIQKKGHVFNYETSSQLHGFSIGLSKTRHLYKKVKYDENTREYYID